MLLNFEKKIKMKTHAPFLSFITALLGFTLEAKFVSSKHLIQVHLEILSCSVENMASHLLTKHITLNKKAVNLSVH